MNIKPIIEVAKPVVKKLGKAALVAVVEVGSEALIKSLKDKNGKPKGKE